MAASAGRLPECADPADSGKRFRAAFAPGHDIAMTDATAGSRRNSRVRLCVAAKISQLSCCMAKAAS